MKSRFKTFIFSVILATALISSCGWFLSAGWIYLLVIIGHFLFLILAGILLALRFSFFVYRQQFFYIFIATFNLCLGFHAVFSYLFGPVNINYPEMMSINLLVGMVMLVDALLLKRKPYEQSLNKG
ncbi:MAG: hypothetical protein BGO55_12535 [Sphingobacteriales bacterium 50-39]|nr:hypothetical protein [Sphingobacteriales bacterium]OJW57139.1 MAG: hypothetical protein BGO55_12535 [Sphingobacteriales bacterium 50-39]